MITMPRAQQSRCTFGAKVYKIGKVTGLTCGTLNGVRSSIVFPDSPTRYKAWEVVTKGWADQGDSGALCYDQDRTWCGLYFGGEPGKSGGFVIPADVILRDIEKMAGGSLVLPSTRSRSVR